MLVEGGIVLVKIRFVGIDVLRDAKAIAEALIVYDLALSQEAKRVFDVGIVDKAQEIVVG